METYFIAGFRQSKLSLSMFYPFFFKLVQRRIFELDYKELDES